MIVTFTVIQLSTRFCLSEVLDPVGQHGHQSPRETSPPPNQISQGLFKLDIPLEHDQKTSKPRCREEILIRCPNHLAF